MASDPQDDTNDAVKDVFIPIKNIHPKSFGYFTNSQNTGYIRVMKDKIVYNKYESDGEQVKNGQRSIIKLKPNYVSILSKTVDALPIQLGDGCGFSYQYDTDSWVSKDAQYDIDDDTWNRTSYVNYI